MAITIKRGYASKIYYNTASFGTPTWVECTLVGDATVKLTFEEDDATTRGDGVKAAEPTLLGIEVTGRMRSDENNTQMVAWETAFFTRALLDLLVLDSSNATNGGRGIRYEGKLFDWSEDQALGKVLFRDFMHKPCASENARQKAIISGGSPVLTAI